MRTIAVAGALANKPFSGGEAWVRLSWALGLRRLGYDVLFLEQLPAATWDEGIAARAYFADVVTEHGLAGRAALLRDDGGATEGLPWEAVLDLAGDAELLVNISGHLEIPEVVSRFGRTAFVDIDPGYTQIWHETGALRLAPHDRYFTIAENIGAPGCSLPAAGIDWHPTRQPVVLGDWPVRPADVDAGFTTIATWRTPFGRLEHDGRTYGMKLDEFRKVAALPARVDARFTLALDIHPAEKPDLRLLAEQGWEVVDAPHRVVGPGAFRDFVAASAAEFSPAQGVYVETASGWFSDRSARYLASGRPVLVQDTGFGRSLPVGEGLLAYRTLDDAVRGATAIATDHRRHADAARRIAEEHFDSDAVLARFLDRALA